MINFWLASREKPGADRDMFDFEWGVIHVALMLTTPSVMEGFVKYSQHRSPDDVPDELFVYGKHEKQWYSIANHLMRDISDLQKIFSGEDYPRRMTPHSFGDKEFVIELTRVLTDRTFGAGPQPGRGVKVVNFLSAAEDVDRDTFERVAREEHAERIFAVAEHSDDIRRYILNVQLPLDAAMFNGTLFELGGVQTYTAVEELWFPSVEAAERFRLACAADPELRAVEDTIIDRDRSFSMVAVERVVWDYSGSDAPPRPAIDSRDSVEAGTLASERKWGDWNTILPES